MENRAHFVYHPLGPFDGAVDHVHRLFDIVTTRKQARPLQGVLDGAHPLTHRVMQVLGNALALFFLGRDQPIRQRLQLDFGIPQRRLGKAAAGDFVAQGAIDSGQPGRASGHALFERAIQQLQLALQRASQGGHDVGNNQHRVFPTTSPEAPRGELAVVVSTTAEIHLTDRVHARLEARGRSVGQFPKRIGEQQIQVTGAVGTSGVQHPVDIAPDGILHDTE